MRVPPAAPVEALGVLKAPPIVGRRPPTGDHVPVCPSLSVGAPPPVSSALPVGASPKVDCPPDSHPYAYPNISIVSIVAIHSLHVPGRNGARVQLGADQDDGTFGTIAKDGWVGHEAAAKMRPPHIVETRTA